VSSGRGPVIKHEISSRLKKTELYDEEGKADENVGEEGTEGI